MKTKCHAVGMLTMELPLPLTFLDRMEKRIVRDLSEAEEQWGEIASSLTKWEDDNLLDNPTPEKLKTHKDVLTQLIRVGKLISLGSTHPDFPKKLSQNVSATLEVLQDKMIMWHGEEISAEEADKILHRCGLL